MGSTRLLHGRSKTGACENKGRYPSMFLWRWKTIFSVIDNGMEINSAPCVCVCVCVCVCDFPKKYIMLHHRWSIAHLRGVCSVM